MWTVLGQRARKLWRTWVAGLVGYGSLIVPLPASAYPVDPLPSAPRRRQRAPSRGGPHRCPVAARPRRHYPAFRCAYQSRHRRQT